MGSDNGGYLNKLRAMRLLKPAGFCSTFAALGNAAPSSPTEGLQSI
jgi:hypothetical protein